MDLVSVDFLEYHFLGGFCLCTLFMFYFVSVCNGPCAEESLCGALWGLAFCGEDRCWEMPGSFPVHAVPTDNLEMGVVDVSSSNKGMKLRIAFWNGSSSKGWENL